MVLTIDGKVVTKIENVFSSEYVEKRNAVFSKSKPILFSLKTNSIHVFQKECIVCQKGRMGSIRYVGSNEATTCAIFAVYSLSSGKCFLVHIDDHESQVSKEVLCFIENNFRKDERLICHIVGCYNEESGLSENIAKAIIIMLMKSDRVFGLETCMLLGSNSKNHPSEDEHLPIFRNFCVDMETGEAFPSIYPKFVEEFEEGPEYESRHARICAGNGKIFKVDFLDGKLTIPLFSFTSYFSSFQLNQVMKLPDEFLLDNFSTSPNAESDTFVPVMKLGFKFSLKYPNSELYFKDETKSRNYYFDKSTGWKRMGE